MRPDDMTRLEVLGDRHPHGVRVKYMTGCRCVPCRAANSRYETERALARKNGDWNGLVSAGIARRHLLRLSRRGIGRDTVAEASGVSITSICEIKSGRKKNIRLRTHKAIMAVDASARADKTLVGAAPVWALIDRLLKEGLSRKELARRLGSRAKVPALQLNHRVVTAKNAARVERLFSMMMLGVGISRRRKLRTRSIPQKRVA
jgi:hypothetical protein